MGKRSIGTENDERAGDDRKTKNKIRIAWAAIAKHRQESTSRSYLLRQRRCLFDAVITPSMLHGARTWMLTVEHDKVLPPMQRKMLRLIVREQEHNIQ